MHQAVTHLRKLSTVNKMNKTYRILDLGCSSGALLLGTIKGTMATMMNNINIIGIGVDLDDTALNFASINAAANIMSSDSTAVGWMKADFTQLHSEVDRIALLNAVVKCQNSMEIDSEVETDGLFQVILCNPPFLSARAATGRVTLEDKSVLVSGITGMEAYIGICNSIQQTFKEIAEVGDSTVRGNSNLKKMSRPSTLLTKHYVDHATNSNSKEKILQSQKTVSTCLISNMPLLSRDGVIIFQGTLYFYTLCLLS